MAATCDICLTPNPEYTAGRVRVCEDCAENNTRGQLIFNTFDLYKELAEQNIRYLLTKLSIHSHIGQRTTEMSIPKDEVGFPPKTYNYLSDILLEIGQKTDDLNYREVIETVNDTYWNFTQVADHGTPGKIEGLAKLKQAEYIHDRELLTGGFATGGLRRLVILKCYRPYENQFDDKYNTTIDQIIGLIDSLADPIGNKYDNIIGPQRIQEIYLNSQSRSDTFADASDTFDETIKKTIANLSPTELDNLWFTESELWQMAKSNYDSREAFSNALNSVTISINEASGKASRQEPEHGFSRPYRLPRDVGTTERYVFICDPGDPDEYFMPLMKRAYKAVLSRFWTEIDRGDPDDSDDKWGDYVEDLTSDALHRLSDDAEIYKELYYTDENGKRSEIDLVVLADGELFHFACKSRDLKPPTRAGIDAVREIEQDINSDSGIAGGIKQSKRLERSILSGETTKLSADGQEIDVSHINSEEDFHSVVVFGAHYDQVAVGQYEAFLDDLDPVFVTDIYSLDMFSRVESTYPQSMRNVLGYIAMYSPSLEEAVDLTQYIKQIRSITLDEYLSYIRFRDWCYESELLSITNIDEADIFYAYRHGLLGYGQTALFHWFHQAADDCVTNFMSIAGMLTESTTQAKILLKTLEVERQEWDRRLYITSSQGSTKIEFRMDNMTGDAGTLLRLSTVGSYFVDGRPHPPVSTN